MVTRTVIAGRLKSATRTGKAAKTTTAANDLF
jgi:hypothetical protein